MNAREYAKNKGFNVVGKLTYKGVHRAECEEPVKWWIDEDCNEYWRNLDGAWLIVTKDGAVI